MQRVHFQLAERAAPVEVVLERGENDGAFNVRVGETRSSVAVEWTGPQQGFLRVSGRVVAFHAASRKGAVEVWTAGRRYAIEVIDRSAQRVRGGAASEAISNVIAAMPGTVLRIDVKPDDVFAAHQPLVVMESMKMEMTLTAPHPGRVKAVRCKVGQLVDMGAVLIEVEPMKDDADLA